jgi:hypothetical protein
MTMIRRPSPRLLALAIATLLPCTALAQSDAAQSDAAQHHTYADPSLRLGG